MDHNTLHSRRGIDESFIALEKQSMLLSAERLLRALCNTGAFAHLGFLFFFLLIDAYWLAAVNVVSVIIWLIAAIQNVRQRHQLCVRLIVLEMVGHALIVTIAMGTHLGFHYYLWPLAALILASPVKSVKKAIIICLVIAVSFICAYLLSRNVEYTYALPELIPYVYSINVILAIVPFIIVMLYLKRISTSSAKRFFIEANTDAMTGAYNRRYIEQLFSSGTSERRRHFEQYMVLICDIEKLSDLNGRFGHEVTDQVINSVHDAIKSNIRDTDVLARWSGEEFLILLTNANYESTQMLAEKIQRSVEQEYVVKDISNLPVMLSFGIGASSTARDFSDVVRMADLDMYQAKAKKLAEKEFD
ncbi:GGDEF domain-containing protein [Agaribacter marinus]|uniref:diguanylate cyclase n=1 Tax=Agaribacter marinus TaxID=1431249 RepID=A0AA37SWY7_9ALTE|nr:diguanylate cyclase [Agaribacter marinus]GLR70597.1 GGDEF domain-containing protein [Agaribacter marinus]